MPNAAPVRRAISTSDSTGSPGHRLRIYAIDGLTYLIAALAVAYGVGELRDGLWLDDPECQLALVAIGFGCALWLAQLALLLRACSLGQRLFDMHGYDGARLERPSLDNLGNDTFVSRQLPMMLFCAATAMILTAPVTDGAVTIAGGVLASLVPKLVMLQGDGIRRAIESIELPGMPEYEPDDDPGPR